MALIVVSIVFGFNLGVWFSALMVVMACGYILYYTSNIMHQYRTDQYVAAALALFASVALLFWYVLRILMSVSNRR
jgi:FtsH-binding integral membrane protein